MALPAFKRATERLLARLGEEALFRGTTACKIPIERGVEAQGDEGQVVYVRAIATMPKDFAPRRGDALAIGETVDGVFVPAETFVVDGSPFADNGYTVRVVLR